MAFRKDDNLDNSSGKGFSARRLVGRFRILEPMRIRDFALLWTAMTVSLLGDGIYYVAIAWQVYRLSNVPTALSLVWAAWTLPMVGFLMIGGVISDRFDRRKVMITSDILRGLAIAVIGVLSLTQTLELSHLFVLVALYGTGEAFFGPAFGAIVPDLVPRNLLVEANSLDQFVRPLMLRMTGPALGGATIALFGIGEAFLLDAGTFALSAIALMAMSARPIARSGGGQSAVREMKQGLSFVRSHTWLWGTLTAASIGLLLFWGPFEVLVPYIVKNQLNGDAADLGFVYAWGGVGAILAALVLGQRGLPRRHMTFMYAAFGISIGVTAGFAFATSMWQAMAWSFISGGTATAGMVVWGTLMHTLVPREMLGRVTSLDWTMSIGLVPVSFALTGPAAQLFGVDRTMIGAGIAGGVVFTAFLFLPGMRDTERSTDGLHAQPTPVSIQEAASEEEVA
ncbi:MAG: MFS transporter [Actinomycetota bacterium]|nr:MFS transporter [Actinomycetota bacterium]